MIRRLGIQIITLLIILSSTLIVFTNIGLSAPPIYENIIIVDQIGNGDFLTIHDAIENASTLSVIRIKAGIYKEHNLSVDKRIIIEGEGPGKTIIDLGGNEGFSLLDSHIEIKNLNIINSGEFAILVSRYKKYCNISNCEITSAKAHGIIINGMFTVVLNCYIQGEGSFGQGIKIQTNDNYINLCKINGFENGILVLINSYNNYIENCDLIDNNVGIDIRINSKNNTITNCNIYGNTFGVYIWQNSNDNRVYLNNFWKNDINAIDESNNTWETDTKGNYWDDYKGSDNNKDDIGDSPYIISEKNIDKFPLIKMILPNIISVPDNLKHTSTPGDNTPSFSWNPSIYNKGVKGYFVRIDRENELYIGDITSWTSPFEIKEGVHTFYIRALGFDNLTSFPASLTFVIDTRIIDTDGDGWSDEDEQFYGTNPNDIDNYPLDTDKDGIPDLVDKDDDNDGYFDEIEISYGRNPKESNDYPYDSDNDKIPDEDSTDGIYIGDVDDDNDGLNDLIEKQLGSNSKQQGDTYQIHIIEGTYYLVDISNDSLYDILYNPSSDTAMSLMKNNYKYLIDIEGDGIWEYIYDINDNSISVYKDEEKITPLFISLLLIILLITIIVVIKLYSNINSRFHIKKPIESEKIGENLMRVKPSELIKGDNKETQEMVYDAITLLQNIQKDVNVYLEKLNYINNQIDITSTEIEKEKISIPLKQYSNKKSKNVEAEVDEFLKISKVKRIGGKKPFS